MIVTTYSEYSASAEHLHLLGAPMGESLRPRLTTALRGVDPAADRS